MDIGYVPDPRSWDRWAEAEAMLEPARIMGGLASVLEQDEILWAVEADEDLLACATTRLTEDGSCDVVLVGGRNHRLWLGQLNNRIGAAAAEAGATRMTACGRAGWVKSLEALGWASIGDGRARRYERALGG